MNQTQNPLGYDLGLVFLVQSAFSNLRLFNSSIYYMLTEVYAYSFVNVNILTALEVSRTSVAFSVIQRGGVWVTKWEMLKCIAS